MQDAPPFCALALAAVLTACVAGNEEPVVSGNDICADTSAAAAYLAERYNERVVGAGLSRDGTVMMFFLSPEGTWTVTTSKDGTTCVRDTGTHWLLAGSKAS